MVGAAPTELRKDEKSAASLVAAASRHLAADDLGAAVDALANAAAVERDSLALHFMTAFVAWRSEDLAKALHLMRSCFEREPMNGTIADVLASLFAQVGDLQESVFHGKLATALGPDAQLQGLVPASFPAFDKVFLAIQDRPLFAHAKYCRANGDVPLALDRARQHVEVAPEDNEARQFYAELLLRFGMAGAALEALAPAVEGRNGAPSLVSLYARALTAVGDFGASRQWHDKARSMAPQDAAVAAARLADAIWLGDAATEMATAGARWVSRFTKPGKPAVRRAPGAKLAIGYIVADFVDRRDVASVAAVARAHDRDATQVIGYGFGAKTWDENLPLAGAFDQWRDISRVDDATFARMMASDGLDIVIDVGGWTAPAILRALARASAILRVAWLHEPAGLETIYDAVLVGGGWKPAAATPIPWRAGAGGYPILPSQHMRRSIAVEQSFRLGADIDLRQLDGSTVAFCSALLDAIPHAALLLRQNDMASPMTVDRLIACFGRHLAARIDIVDAAAAGDFYRQVDLAVAPLRGTSSRIVAEALSHGVPALALQHDGVGQAYAGFLRDIGLAGELVATSAADGVERAKALAASAEARSRIDATVRAALRSAESSAATIARAIEERARETLAERPA